MPISEGELIALDAFHEGAIEWLIPDCPLALHTQVRPMAFDVQLQSMISQRVLSKGGRPTDATGWMQRMHIAEGQH